MTSNRLLFVLSQDGLFVPLRQLGANSASFHTFWRQLSFLTIVLFGSHPTGSSLLEVTLWQSPFGSHLFGSSLLEVTLWQSPLKH